NAFQRDRVRALQLMQQAQPLIARELLQKAVPAGKDGNISGAVAAYYLHFAEILLHGAGYYEAWRLQYFTNLVQLPDYGEGYNHGGGGARGAPVDAAGNPIYYQVPKSYEAAKNDGECWRWMLMQAAEFDPGRKNETDMILADFMRGQLGPQTM